MILELHAHHLFMSFPHDWTTPSSYVLMIFSSSRYITSISWIMIIILTLYLICLNTQYKVTLRFLWNIIKVLLKIRWLSNSTKIISIYLQILDVKWCHYPNFIKYIHKTCNLSMEKTKKYKSCNNSTWMQCIMV